MLHRSKLKREDASLTIYGPLVLIAFGLLLVLAAASCAGTADDRCIDNAECASGLCRGDGTCAPEADGGGTGGDAGESGADADISGCSPDHDGIIQRDEITVAAGRTATFRVALDTPVNTAGQLQSGGERSWSFAGPFTGDADVLVELEPVAGSWFASVFPGATYATRLSQTQELKGVFEITDDALLLRGVVSPEAGLTRTELTYDPPIKVLELPLSTSSSWSTSSTVSGLAQGVTALYSETYDQQVDAVGSIDTPYGNFPVQRVRVELTRTVGVTVVTLRSFSFVAECFGVVAQASSHEYESDVEFTDAAEVRRIAP